MQWLHPPLHAQPLILLAALRLGSGGRSMRYTLRVRGQQLILHAEHTRPAVLRKVAAPARPTERLSKVCSSGAAPILKGGRG